VPKRQRAFYKALIKHSFQRALSEKPKDETDVQIIAKLNVITKRLRVSCS
jgi:hypothetical protein